MMLSAEGGVDIEEWRQRLPRRSTRSSSTPQLVFSPIRRASSRLLWASRKQVDKATRMMRALYQAFIATDASLVEINPLIDRQRRASRSTPR